MKRISINKFSELIDNDISWRKKELSFLKTTVEKYKDNQFKEKTFIRSSYPIIYAHWEGFIKNASIYYLKYVASQNLKYSDISIELLSLALKSKLNEVVDSNRTQVFLKTTDFILNKLDYRCKIPFDIFIDTESNLNSSVLKNITMNVGIVFSDFETRANWIDLSLLKNRNKIAHGEDYEIKYEYFLDDLEMTRDLLELYRNLIENAACNKAYLRT
ncbi:MAG: MAE_28990/MAE_18760 family HEPN-like nuclease [Candidatus Hatepunaea meridiana]|nr:MAE_28990/MAE_18760 family HEPN-like nuclease [Candidatus Hatepunaea meridiana]